MLSCNLKGAAKECSTVVYAGLAAAYSKIARTGVKVGKTRLLPLVLLRVKENIRATDH